MTSSRTQSPTPPIAGGEAQRAGAVREMFSAIAPRYDLLNHVLSLNVDRAWRRRAVRALGWEARPDGIYLDACAGTFDLAIELTRQRGFAGHVLAADFAPAMLREGLSKILGRPILPVCADALCLPVPSGAFDGALIAFGVRNLANIDEGLRELRRSLKPGARLVVLDFATPRRQPWKGLYLLYFTRLLPFIGRLISKHSYAYTYLPESVLDFPEPAELADRMGAVGFGGIGWRRMTGGIACLWWGIAS